MILSIILIFTILFLAYSNGANDNFKGVATLFGSKTTSFKNAINWATITTLAGSVASVFFATELVKNFSGKGLIQDNFIISPSFAIAVALGAALTVFIATKIGMPISTTHGIVGALTGARIMAAGSTFNFGKLGGVFFLPLLLSPLIAATLSLILYNIFKHLKNYSGITQSSCACLIQQTEKFEPTSNAILLENSIALKTGHIEDCEKQYFGTIVGISAQRVLDSFHFISAGAVGFARGLNDTPKIMGLLLLVSFMGLQSGGILIAVAIALGGLFNAKKVGETMSIKISKMNHGQGFTANVITAILVSTASFNGLPVSTTHVSVGSITGIGIHTKQANFTVIKNILLSWLLTLPVAAILSAVIYYGTTNF